ncbi:MAG: hypothetical protein ACYCU5_06190 [Actinomycetes bacterium]
MADDVGRLEERAVHYDPVRDGDFREWMRAQQQDGWTWSANTGGAGTPYVFRRTRIGPPG